MAYPRTKGTERGEKARQPRPGIPLKNDTTIATVLMLIKKEHGNLSRVADSIGTTRGAIRSLCDTTPELKEALIDARERQLDVLEKSCFDRAIESNDTTLQLFLLKTQGRSRGYDQWETQSAAKDVAAAAFDYIINKTKHPVT